MKPAARAVSRRGSLFFSVASPRAAAALVALLGSLLPLRAAGDLPGISDRVLPRVALGAVIEAGESAERSAAYAPLTGSAAGAAAPKAGPGSVLWCVLPHDLEHGDTADLDRRIANCRLRGQDVVVALRGNLSAVAELAPRERDASRRGWNEALRLLARRQRGQVAWYRLDDILRATGIDDRGLAFALKSAAITLQGEDPAASFALGMASDAEVERLVTLYGASEEIAAYVDGFAFRQFPHEALVEGLPRWRARFVSLDPGAPLFVEERLENVDGDVAAQAWATDDALARAAELLAAGADLAALGNIGNPRALASLANTLPAGAGLTDRQGQGVSIEAVGPEPRPAVRWAYFFDAENFREAIVFWSDSSAPSDAPMEAKISLDRSLRRDWFVANPAGRPIAAPRGETVDGRLQITMSLLRRPLFLFVNRDKVSPGFAVDDPAAESRATRGVDPYEVIAAHQRWRSFQDDRLATIQRDAMIAFRIRITQAAASFDLALRTKQFTDRDTGSDFVIQETLFNGVKLPWDKVPEIPFISREKVLAVPLDLNLDKRYRYEYIEEDTVEGRRCWVLRFEPVSKEGSLYRGRAWIEQGTAALVKVTTLQNNLEPPLLSNEETQLYAPVVGPDGTSFWLPARIDGQQIYTISGSNVAVLREITFGPPTINAEGFAAARQEAYASPKQILRDTDSGYKWVTMEKDGTRKVLEKGDPDQWFAVGGLLKDGSQDSILPLAGVNYTNIDWLERKLILNVFFAGVLANASLSDPGFLGTRLDAGLVFSGFAVHGTDKTYANTRELENQRVGARQQSLFLTLGYPLGEFVKLRTALGTAYNDYKEDDETSQRFELPADHLLHQAKLQFSFDRKGWGVFAEGTYNKRSKWERWGLPDRETGILPVSAQEAETARDFTTHKVSLQKDFFLPYFQKIVTEARYLGGSDFDRFSAYSFDNFGGEGLPGFSGAGIRFDRGAIFKLGYDFSLAEIVRFDFEVNHGYVRDFEVDPARSRSATGADSPRLHAGAAGSSEGSEFSNHTGIGIAANFAGPWRTLVRFNAGYALASDLKQAEGETEFLLAVLKLF